MTKLTTSKAVITANFIAGLALLILLSPHRGMFNDRPAGVRTAVETVGNKPSYRKLIAGIAISTTL